MLGMSVCITHNAKPTPVVCFCFPIPGIWIQYSETEVREITPIGCSAQQISTQGYRWRSWLMNILYPVNLLFSSSTINSLGVDCFSA